MSAESSVISMQLCKPLITSIHQILDHNACTTLYGFKSGNLEIITSSNYADYNTLLNSLGYKMNFLGAGINACVVQICLNLDYVYALKIVPYSKNKLLGDISNPNRPENVEVNILYQLSRDILDTGLSPHIIRFLHNDGCYGIPCLWSNGCNKGFDTYIKYLLNFRNHAQRAVSGNYSNLIFTEFAKYGSFDKFLDIHEVNHVTLGILYFQILYTLAHIQNIYPGFRHNDLHPGNILIHANNTYSDTACYYTYIYDNQKYYIPGLKYQIKLCDFDMANIIGMNYNAKVQLYNSERTGYRHSKNHYYDLHRLTLSLLKIRAGTYKGIKSRFESIAQDADIFALFERIVPNIYCTRPNVIRGQLIPDIEYTSPHSALKHDAYFMRWTIPECTAINIDTYGV